MIDRVKFREALDKFYTKSMLYNLYKEYFINWIAEGYIAKDWDIFKISLINDESEKEVFLDLIEEFFWDKSIFRKIYKTLPEKLKNIFEKIFCDGEYIIDESEKTQLLSQIGANYYKDLEAQYQFFKCDLSNFNKNYIYIDYDILRHIRLNFLDKEEYKLISVTKEADVLKKFYRNDNSKEFLNNMNLYLEFFNSGAIKISNSGKILKDSKKNMMKHCNITEYYNVKGLEDLKTETISLLFVGMENEYKNHKYFSANNIKQIVNDFMTAKIFNKNEHYLYTTLFLNHLKGIKNIWKHSEKLEECSKSLVTILKEIKRHKYISVESIIKSYIYHDENVELINFEDVKDYIYINEANYQRSKIGDYNSYFQYVTTPFVKSFIYILGIFGVFELLYSSPASEDNLYLKAGYLSKYDGLKYIKLTPLGEYVFGLVDNYEIPTNYEKADIQLDDKRLLITIVGESPTRRMFFEEIGIKIGNNLYKITKDSFSKRLKSSEELEERIDKFKELTDSKLTKIWEEFFEDIRVKYNSIKLENKYVVLKLENNKELLQIIVKDNRFRELTLKAENYHLIVEKENLSKLLKIFNEYGYQFNIE